jgi:hypothetical protein
VIWYQCDEGDADVASFFYFLSLTLANHPSKQAKPLPSLSPELYSALPTFVRNYFREFCARLAAPTFVVSQSSPGRLDVSQCQFGRIISHMTLKQSNPHLRSAAARKATPKWRRCRPWESLLYH